MRSRIVTGLLAAIMLFPSLAQAQVQSETQKRSEPDDASAKDIEEIIVTGSRIARDGSDSPSPLTVSSAEDLNKVAPT